MVRTLAHSVVAFFVLCVAPEAPAFEPPGRVDASAVQADGKVVYATWDQSNSLVAFGRLNPDGTRDTLFGGGCCQAYLMFPQSGPFEVKALAVLQDQRIVLHMVRNWQPVFLRFNADGTTDTTFGIDGTVTDLQAPEIRISALAPASDGKLLGFGSIPGSPYGPERFAAVVRYNADGTRDATFGSSGDGVQASPLGGHYNAASVTSSGKVLATGHYASGGQYRNVLVARFLWDGTPDTGFGPFGMGLNFADPTWYHDEGFAVTADSSGEIVVVGGATAYSGPPGASNVLVARFTADGIYSGYTEHYVTLGSPYPTFAVGAAILASPSGTLAVGANVYDYQDGQPRIALLHLGTNMTRVLPPGDYLGQKVTSLHAAPGEQVLVVGSKNLASQYSAARYRLWIDNLTFDTDFETEGQADTTPDAFTIPSVVGAAPHSEVTSEPFRITGINQPTPVFGDIVLISVGCNEPFVPSAMVENGQYICARLTAGAPATTVGGVVTVGGVQAGFSVSTAMTPDTTIVLTPPNPSGPMVVFHYIGSSPSGPVMYFECRFDGEPFTPCNSGHQGFGPLSVGPHTFEVRAVNPWGPDDTPASHSWSVAPPPETTITSGPPLLTNATTATFTFTSSEGGPYFLCQKDDETAWASCTSPTTYPVVQNGNHTFRVRAAGALDADPTPATYSWTVDTIAPDTDITAYSGSITTTSSAWFNYAALGEAAQTFQCRLDGAAWYDCGGGNTIVFGVSPGQHQFEVRAVDAAGNADATPDSKTWTYISSPPETLITSGPSGTVGSTSATFTYESTQSPVTYECGLADVNGGVSFAACPANGVTFTGLGDGRHVFHVRARNSAGMVDNSAATREWFIDLVAPDTTITAGPEGSVNNATATFQFAANESGAAFACSLDGAAFTACSSPATYTGIADGTHRFSVRASDPVGNLGDPVTRAWHVDLTGPDTSITSGPTGNVAVTTAQFAFDANELNVAFQCRLDGAAFAACSSPVSYSGLSDGAHAFEVRALDLAGNMDPSPAVASWTVDTSAPDTVIDTGPSGTVGQGTAAFTFHASEPGTTFECSLDAAPFAACSSGHSYSGLVSGMHMFEVRAVDALGNADATAASRTWSVDLTQPATTLSTGPSAVTAETAATFAFTSSEPGTFVCSLDGAAFTPCTSPVNYAGLASGSHSFAVYAIDAVGNGDASPATWSWVIDAMAPDTTITSAPPAASSSTSAAFTFTSSEGGSTFECSLDAGAFAPCTSPRSYSGLAQGSHTFRVRATDALGNQDGSAATRTWTVDTAAPDTTIASGPSGNNNPSSATFTHTSSEAGSTFQCKLDAGAFVACDASVTYSGLPKGQHTFQVRAIDAAGNVDATPATRTWRSN